MLSQETHKHKKLYQKDKFEFEFIGDIAYYCWFRWLSSRDNSTGKAMRLRLLDSEFHHESNMDTGRTDCNVHRSKQRKELAMRKGGE